VTRRYSFFFRKPGMERAAFSAYYEGPHGHLIAGLPEFWRYTDRYIQNHVQPPVAGLTGRQPEWDGISELWQPTDAPPQNFFDEQAYKDNVGPDEPNFITVSGKLRLAAEPTVVVDGPPSKIKLLALIRRRPDIRVADFRGAWAEYGAKTTAVTGFSRYVRRYVQNNVVPETVSAVSGHAGYDGIGELWFDSIEDALAAQVEHERGFVSEDACRFLVQEVLIPRPSGSASE
jgi:hypothetical protein